MGRCGLALACTLAGCGFSAKLDGDRTGLAIDAASTDALADAYVGNEAPVAAMTAVTSAADVYLRTSLAPDQNTNDLDYMIVDGDNLATAILRFDLAAIPATAVVTSATLELYVDGDAGEPVTAYQLLEGWDEATATSNSRMTGVAWLGAGATPPSRGTTAVATLSPSTPNAIASAAVDAAVVQGWITAPATNHGLAISTTNDDGPRFGSREKVTAAQRPVLRVAYTN